MLEVRLAAQPGEDLEAVKQRFEAVVDTPVSWRGFHAHGFEIDPDAAAVRGPGQRAHDGPRDARWNTWPSPAPPTRGRSSSTTPRPPPVTARSAATCTRRTSGSTSRASRPRRSCSPWPRRPGAAADRPRRAACSRPAAGRPTPASGCSSTTSRPAGRSTARAARTRPARASSPPARPPPPTTARRRSSAGHGWWPRSTVFLYDDEAKAREAFAKLNSDATRACLAESLGSEGHAKNSTSPPSATSGPGCRRTSRRPTSTPRRRTSSSTCAPGAPSPSSSSRGCSSRSIRGLREDLTAKVAARARSAS